MKDHQQTPPNEFTQQRIDTLHTWITHCFEAYPAPLPGMLLLTGPAACGKTTLLTAWMKHRPQRSPYDPDEDDDDLFDLSSYDECSFQRLNNLLIQTVNDTFWIGSMQTQ